MIKSAPPVTASIFAMLLAACSTESQNDSADIVLTGGIIYSADSNRSVHQAIAVKDGRIIAVGTDAQIEKYVGANTDHRRLDGKMVLPGLHDMHIHALGTIAPEACDLDSRPVSLEEMVEIIQGCIVDFDIADGEWVPVMQWNPYEGNQPSAAHPTLRAALDAASDRHPVFLLGSDGHHGGANSLALQSVTPALSAETLKTEYRDLDGLVAVDADGEPTGGLNEGAMSLVGEKAEAGLTMPAPDLMPRVAELLASRGLTSIQDAWVQWEELEQYKWLDDADGMTFRLRTALNYPLQNGHTAEDLARVPAMIDELKKMRAAVSDSRYIRTDATKLFADGVMEGDPFAHPPTLPVAAMLEPYHQPIFKIDDTSGATDVVGYVDPQSAVCQPVSADPDAFASLDARQAFERDNGFLPKQCLEWSGMLEHSADLIKAYVQQATDAGFHVHVHAIAEKAVRVAADAFELAKASADRQGLTQSLAHVQIANEDDLKRLGKLGVYIAYTYYWILPNPDYDMTVIPFVDKIAGAGDLYNAQHSYMQRAYAVRTAMDAGVIPVFGSDAPVDSRDPRPFMNMEQALTRADKGLILNAAERINIHDAIASYTSSSAAMMARADELGSLEVGKLADLIVIDRDIVALAENDMADQIGDTRVLTTIFDGRIVFEAKD